MRKLFTGGAVAVLAVAGLAAPAAADTDEIQLTLLGTTDTHGHVYNWDYFENAPYTSEADVLGLTLVSTYVNEVRDEVGEESVILMDSGDALQGTPLTYYYGMGEGADSVLSGEVEHPISATFKHIGYDTLGIGNHEFNYGLEMLRAYERDLDTEGGGPALLGANVIDVETGEPWLEPYTVVERVIDGETVKVGVIGLVTPGVRIWDKKFVDGVLEFEDLVASARKWVPIVAQEADVVVLNAHSGMGNVPDEDYNEQALYENVINNVAYQVPGIDFILFGHSHQDNPETIITNTAGEKVLLSQPYYWTRSVTRTTLNLVKDGEGWTVDWSAGKEPTAVATYGHEIQVEDEDLQAFMREKHETTIDYVNTPVATSVTDLKAETSRYEDTPIMDFINNVQMEVLQAELADEFPGATIVAQASPFSRTAIFPEGDVTIRDIAGLYIYENTLLAVELTGGELKDYLEFSARFFNQVEPGAEFDPETGTNAVYPDRPEGVPDYAYDVLSGVDYYIDISQDVGERITGLTHPDGTPVEDDDQIILGLNNYRQSGGADFPHVAQAPVVYDGQEEIRQMLIEWALEHEVIDPDDFFEENWFLITEPLEETPDPDPTETEDPEPDPTEDPDPAEDPDPTDEPVPDPTETDDGDDGGSLPESGAPVGPLAAVTAVLLLIGSAVLISRRRFTDG